MQWNLWVAVVSLLVVAVIHAAKCVHLTRRLNGHEHRLRVLEGLLGARGLLPDEPREAVSGTEQLRIARTGEEMPW